MAVIDVDSHWEPAFVDDEHPLERWKDSFPSHADVLTEFMTGDLGRGTPAAARPAPGDIAALFPRPNASMVERSIGTDPGRPEFEATTAEGFEAWMDRVGIDHCFVNPGTYGAMLRYLGPDRAEGTRRCNDYLADHLEGRTHRLSPVTLLELSDLEWSVAELTRMRGRGSRCFYVVAQPFHGMSPAHPQWDRLWAAATDLGMVGVVHSGNTPTNFEGWGNAGWDEPGGSGLAGYLRYAYSMRHQSAEMMLGGLVCAGVFGRHPNLTVVSEENLISWLPAFVARMSAPDRTPWPYELSPGEMVRRNIRATPLPGVGDKEPLDSMLARLPEMLVFSSDYPHGEGNNDPINLYEPVLSSLETDLRNSFMGANMLECFERMGDALV